MATERDKRRRRLLDLVAGGGLRTQDELARALSRAGWTTTQSSISRDIAALGLVKMDGVYRRPARPPRRGDNPDETRVGDAVRSIETAGSALVVLTTGPGEAAHVAVGLDRLSWPEVVGTIAGDDTIFVAVRDAKAQRALVARLRRLSR